jgi:hypothetical protein
MRPKPALLALVLIVLYVATQVLVWRQQKYDYVNNYMFEYTTPRMRKFLSAGHDALLSNLSLIRGIQFYGMNYPLFDKKPTMYEQFKNLSDAATQLDPRSTEAFRFWGFAMTSAERGDVDSYRLLMAGTENLSATQDLPPTPRRPAYGAVQTSVWKVAKDAGYVAQYELKNATPQWTVDAYEAALKSKECPEFVRRLKALAIAKMFPDPMIPISEMLVAYNQSNNEAIRELNLGHIQRLIAEQHKKFWDFAQAAYIDIHGASPTRIAQLTGDIQIMKSAVDAYYDVSREWNDEGTPQLFPNLTTLNPGPNDPIEVEVARPPQLPIDPYGGEYSILEVNGKPNLLATGPYLDERESYLAALEQGLATYKEKHDGACPDDLSLFTEETGAVVAEADGLGYPLYFDFENCRFWFPEISEEDAPPLPPYGQEPVVEEEPLPGLLPEEGEAEEPTPDLLPEAIDSIPEQEAESP